MNRKVVTVVITAGLALSGSLVVQASIKKASVKPITPTVKSTRFKGTSTKKATIKLSRYKTVYAYGKATSKGKFSLKLKHRMHTGWKYRVTVAERGYKTTKKYIKVATSKKPASSKITTTNTTSVTNATQENGNSAITNSTSSSSKVTDATNVAKSSDSPQQTADIALANQYQAKADDLIQELTPLQEQSQTLADEERFYGYKPNSAEYYADLDAKIKSYQEQMDNLLAASTENETSTNYQDLKYHLDQLENEEAKSKQKDADYSKLPDDFKNAPYLSYFTVSDKKDELDAKILDLFNESHHFHQLAHQLYAKYGLDSSPDWDNYYLTSDIGD
jgi:hypothetical protein